MIVDATLEAVVRRDRLVVVTALTAVIALSWAYLLAGAGMGMSAFEMTRMSQLRMAGGMSEEGMTGMAMLAPAVWTPGYAVLMLFMWWIMRVYPGFPTIFRGLSEFFVGDLMGKALWKLVENAQRFPRRGGRVLCVHGPVSFHRARPCATKWPPRRGLRTGPPASSDCGRP